MPQGRILQLIVFDADREGTGMAGYALHAQHVVLPSHLSGAGYLRIENGRFREFSEEKPDCDIVELGNAIVGPGLVDTHIHGFFNHATTDADAAGLNEASQRLAERGTTSWLPTTFTDSVEHITDQCAAIYQATQARDGSFLGARIAGIYLEGPFFTSKHVGAQNPEYLIAPNYRDLEQWQLASHNMVVKSALAPEYPEASAYIEQATASGVVCSLGHSDATYDQAMRAIHAGATCFVHTYNGMRGLHHREPGILGAAMISKEAYAELICDGHHVVPAACEVLVRAKGWEHVVLITDCLGCGGLPEGDYMSGGLPVVLKDNLCYLKNEDGTLGNIAGSVLTLAEGVKNMVDWGIVTPEQAIRMGSEIPARSAHLDRTAGFILPGRNADFNVWVPDLSLEATYIGGVKVA